MNYESIIKRVNKAIASASAKLHSARVHIVDIDSDIADKEGLVIITHPDYQKQAENSQPEQISAS
jgi:hypothetical protein